MALTFLGWFSITSCLEFLFLTQLLIPVLIATSLHCCPTWLLRESVPRQVDKKSRVPEEEKGVWVSRSGDGGLEFSRRRKRQTSFFFSPTFLCLSHIKLFFFLLTLKLIVIQQTTQFKLCTKNYITIGILLEDSFSFLKTF